MHAPTGPAGSLFAWQNRQQLEQSFKEFASRPENKPLLEQHQKEEVSAALQLQEQAQQLQLQQQVSELDPHDARLLAPVLQSQVLRQLLVSLANDATAAQAAAAAATQPAAATTAPAAGISGGSGSSSSAGNRLAAWLGNPRVLQLLREAGKALRAGRVTEEQLAAVLKQQVQAMQQSQAAATEPKAAPHQVMLPSQLLVEALNEHLAERQAGNRAYRQQQYETAMQHYQRALAVVNFVVGSNAADQAEVQHNKASVLLNIAAVHMAQQEWGAAVGCCNEALDTQQGADVAVKALLRRSKANLSRHEYKAALHDLSEAEALEPWHEDIPALRTAVLQAQRAAAQLTDKLLAAKMFGLAT